MSSRRVVITGIGALTPVGKSAPDFWNGLLSGKSGARSIDKFDTTGFTSTFAALIDDYDPLEHFERKEARKLDLVAQYALVASEEAILDSKLNLEEIDKDRVGVHVGTGIGGMKTFYDQSIAYSERGPRGVSPFFIPMLIPDIVSGQISIKYGFRGPNFNPSSNDKTPVAVSAENSPKECPATQSGVISIVLNTAIECTNSAGCVYSVCFKLSSGPSNMMLDNENPRISFASSIIFLASGSD